jgi:hypothetical protein
VSRPLLCIIVQGPGHLAHPWTEHLGKVVEPVYIGLCEADDTDPEWNEPGRCWPYFTTIPPLFDSKGQEIDWWRAEHFQPMDDHGVDKEVQDEFSTNLDDLAQAIANRHKAHAAAKERSHAP